MMGTGCDYMLLKKFYYNRKKIIHPTLSLIGQQKTKSIYILYYKFLFLYSIQSALYDMYGGTV